MFLNKGEGAMKARIDYTNVPDALRGMYQLEHYIHNSGPGGMAGPPGEDARLADQWVRVLPRCAFQRRPLPRRDRTETLCARRVGGGAVLLRARTRGARAY